MASEDNEPLTIRDPDNIYPESAVVHLLMLAQRQGYSLDKGSVIEYLTVRQLDRLVHGKYDC